jgi:hypothetical protein
MSDSSTAEEADGVDGQVDQFELLASSLRADRVDLNAFVEALATKLEGALPAQTRVDRKGGGLFSRTKRTERVEVRLEEYLYVLARANGGLSTTRGKLVRGIVLSTDDMDLDTWIDTLSRDLSRAAERSESARLALERLLHG